jgi:hypothetical protein
MGYRSLRSSPATDSCPRRYGACKTYLVPDNIDRRVFSMRHECRRLSCYMLLKRQSDAAWIQQNPPAMLTDHLNMSMPAGHDIGVVSSEKHVHLVSRRGRQ